MKNKTKLKKALNKDEKTTLTHEKSQLTDSKEVYQANSESQKADSGRSMVEMLGVLAVVGVLSVGGILGYKYAMNKYRANQIANELNLTSSQIAIMLMRPHTEDFELSLGDPYDGGHITTSMHAFRFGCGSGAAEEDTRCTNDAVEYFSEVQGVPEKVCQPLMQLIQNLQHVERVQVNDEIYAQDDICAENNTVKLFFNMNGAEQNPDPTPEQTETETPECDGHGTLQSNGYCRCKSGWYDLTSGDSYDAQNCALSQEDANQTLCNNKGVWAICGCQCDNGVVDSSNNNCLDNDGCCKDFCNNHGEWDASSGCRCESGWYDSTTGVYRGAQDCALSSEEARKKFCNNRGTWAVCGLGCYCESGWYDSTTGKEINAQDCNLTQEQANKKFCNDNGIWERSRSCYCSNGTYDFSNNYCQDNGGCCQNICGEHAYYDDLFKECLCEKGWYTSEGHYYETSNDTDCTMTQAEANTKYCNDNGEWGWSGCECSNGTRDYSNNNCHDNGGCCKICGEHAYSDEGGICYCENGWFDTEGRYNEVSGNCNLSQAAVDKKFCNDNGTWGGSSCLCNNGITDSSNNYCHDNGGCCQIETTTTTTITTTPTYTPEVTGTNRDGCGINASSNYNGKCDCYSGWYTGSGAYYEVGSSNCLINQEEANKKFCNGNGSWYYVPDLHCICKNGTTDSSNNHCQDNGGCCKNI